MKTDNFLLIAAGRGLLASCLACLLFALSMGPLNASGKSHGAVAANINKCDKPGTLPDLACAVTPSAVFDAKGRLWLAWVYGSHVYVNWSDDQGKHYSPPTVVNRVPERVAARGENRPKIALGAQDEIYVTWTTPLAKRYTGNVRFSRSLDGGKHFSDPITVNDNLEVTSHRFEALAVNSEGVIFVAWLDKRDRLAAERRGESYRGAALYYTWSDNQGESFKTNRKIADHTCECCRVAMTLDAQGLPLIAWRHIFDENTRDHAWVRFQDYATVGTIHRATFDEWRIDACPHHGPAIAAGGDGVAHMTWFSNSRQRQGLFYQNLGSQDAASATPRVVGNFKRDASHPHVLTRAGQVYVVWTEFDGTRSQLWLMRSHDAGRNWQAPRLLSETTAGADYAFLLADGKRIYVYWQTNGEGFRFLPVTEAG